MVEEEEEGLEEGEEDLGVEGLGALVELVEALVE